MIGCAGIFDVDRGFLRRFAVRGAGRAENLAERGPLRRRDAGAVIAHDAAAVGDEGDEAGAHLGRVEDVADGVVQIDRVVLLQVCRRRCAPGSLDSVAVNAPVFSPINCIARLA